MTKSIEQQIKLLKKKKERALEVIIDVYMPYVKAIALKILSNSATVDEYVTAYLYKAKNSSIFSADAVTLSGKTIELHSSSVVQSNKKSTVKTKYKVEDIQEPVYIEIENYQHYLKGSATIRIQ